MPVAVRIGASGLRSSWPSVASARCSVMSGIGPEPPDHTPLLVTDWNRAGEEPAILAVPAAERKEALLALAHRCFGPLPFGDVADDP